MPKGLLFPDLTAALTDLRQSRNMSTYAVHNAILRAPESYGASERFSYKSVDHAYHGRPITRRTYEILSSYVRKIDASLMPLRMRPVELNICEFLYTRGNKVKETGEALKGEFQTYAVSTTAEGYVRRGRVSFGLNPASTAISIREWQARPAIGGHPPHQLEWEGNIAPKGEYLFGVLRTVGDCKEGTALFYIIRPTLRDPKTQRIISLSADGMHFEPERGSVMNPRVHLVRTQKSSIVEDFVPADQIADEAIRTALKLPPLRRTPSRRPHRRRRPQQEPTQEARSLIEDYIGL